MLDVYKSIQKKEMKNVKITRNFFQKPLFIYKLSAIIVIALTFICLCIVLAAKYKVWQQKRHKVYFI